MLAPSALKQVARTLRDAYESTDSRDREMVDRLREAMAILEISVYTKQQ